MEDRANSPALDRNSPLTYATHPHLLAGEGNQGNKAELEPSSRFDRVYRRLYFLSVNGLLSTSSTERHTIVTPRTHPGRWVTEWFEKCWKSNWAETAELQRLKKDSANSRNIQVSGMQTRNVGQKREPWLEKRCQTYRTF